MKYWIDPTPEEITESVARVEAFVRGDPAADYPNVEVLRRSVRVLTNGERFSSLPAGLRARAATALLPIALQDVSVPTERLEMYDLRLCDIALLGLAKKPIFRALSLDDQERLAAGLFVFASRDFSEETLNRKRMNELRALPGVLERLRREHILRRLQGDVARTVGELLVEYANESRRVWAGEEFVRVREAPAEEAIRGLRSKSFQGKLRGWLGREARRLVEEYRRRRGYLP